MQEPHDHVLQSSDLLMLDFLSQQNINVTSATWSLSEGACNALSNSRVYILMQPHHWTSDNVHCFAAPVSTTCIMDVICWSTFSDYHHMFMTLIAMNKSIYPLMLERVPLNFEMCPLIWKRAPTNCWSVCPLISERVPTNCWTCAP